MVKPIKNILKTDNQPQNVSLQVVLSKCNFGCRVTCTVDKCIFNHLYLSDLVKFNIGNNFSHHYFSLGGDYKIYKINIFRVAIAEKKINTVSCKISDQSKSLVNTGEEHWKCQRKNKPNCQPSSEDINHRLKLYRSFLSKYRYTSLEIVVRSAAFLADAVAKFRTLHPVRVGSSENNKEHCHDLWQCQTIVDS
ncbi:hypothetical protein [Calothrix sp. NIES-2100]|uniref:hypothetical protein n=1 Tax=Calothrix sp. NIES-2100 TaxID=1954172 RepID=UPI0030DCED04